MPKPGRGIYEKYGYPKAMNIAGDTYSFAASGQTRMMYLCKTRPGVVAKVMPSTTSRYYQPGCVQNKNEAECLRSLSSLPLFPKVHAHYDLIFTNSFGVQDSMNVLLIDRLGMDLAHLLCTSPSRTTAVLITRVLGQSRTCALSASASLILSRITAP